MKKYRKINLSILIPAFNESKNLSILLPKIKSEVKLKNFEIIVIDGFVRDKNTYFECKKNKVNYCQRYNNNSYGEAVRAGIMHSKADYIVIMDADFSHSPKFINKMYKNKNYDVVIASRYIKGGSSENPYYLILMSRLLNYVYSSILSLKIKDISNSFRLYNARKLKNIQINCNNFDLVEEILYKLVNKFKKIKIIELPYLFKKRKFGLSKRNLIFSIAYILTLIRLRFFKF